MAHTRQSRPDSGLGFQVQVLTMSQVVSISLGDLARQGPHRGERPQTREREREREREIERECVCVNGRGRESACVRSPIRRKVGRFALRTHNVALRIVRLRSWVLTLNLRVLRERAYGKWAHSRMEKICQPD